MHSCVCVSVGCWDISKSDCITVQESYLLFSNQSKYTHLCDCLTVGLSEVPLKAPVS